MSDNYEYQFTDGDDISSSSPEFQNESETDAENETALDLNSFSSAATERSANRRKRKRRGKQRVLKVLLTFFLVGIITVSLIAGAFFVWIVSMQSRITDEMKQYDLNDLTLNFTTTIYVDNGDGNYGEYKRLHGTYNRIWMPYDKKAASAGEADYEGIPQNLVDAFVAIEDKRFYSHSGTDWRRTFSAFANMVLHFGGSYGGSTITQQLVKNLTEDNQKSASRKVREILRARYLEEHFSKEVILECYVNTVAMGHGTYGAEVAANYYFDKSAKDLTLTECAALAAITKSPSLYAPDTNPEANKKRRNTVLDEMKSQGFISEEEYNAAIGEELKLVERNGDVKDTEINSWFVDALIDQVKDDLVAKYGYDPKYASNLFYSGGFKIYATLDSKVQSALESVYSDTSYALKAKNGALMQGAMTVVDYKGNVKGIVGGIGEKKENRGFNRATSAVRQPGSTIKPLSAYAPAIEQNIITYSTKLNDTATNYNGWKPVNWYGSYWGNITVKYALERSVNTIPVYLVNKMTPQVSYDFLTQKLGITTLNSNDINLSPMGMGGTNGGITTMESAAAFAIFGNGGYYYKPHLYTRVLDQHDDEVLSYETKGSLAITADTATIMNKLLQNVVYGSNGTGKDAASAIPQMKFYAKTGTTNDQKDLWFVGGSPYYVGSAWCGYDVQQDISTSTIALRMWKAAMSKIHGGLPEQSFNYSEYVVDRYYCSQTGMLATDSCPGKEIGWYKISNLPGICTTHGGKKLDAPAEEKKEEPTESGNGSGSSGQTASAE